MADATRGNEKRSSRLDEARAAILALLEERAPGATICPSEAAKRLDKEHWRELMPEVHQAARRLAADARIDITQGGQPVDPDRTRGPIRLRLKRA